MATVPSHLFIGEQSMKPYGIVYKATNLLNGKCYIGQTIHTLYRRRLEHFRAIKSTHRYYFHEMLEYYGINNFSWSILKVCTDCSELSKWEGYYIKKYESSNSEFGYNSVKNGHTPNEEVRIKISRAKKGRKSSMFGKKRPGKLSGMYGKKHSEETKRKISESTKGRKCSDETKKKLSVWHVGRIMSDETKKKISEAHKGNKNPMFGKKRPGKLSGRYGKKHSDETKKKISESKKGKNRKKNDR